MSKTQSKNTKKPFNAFRETLAVMDIEWLIRLRHRLQRVGRKRMVGILTKEIDRREAAEAKDAA
jgi:hypothetical protein